MARIDNDISIPPITGFYLIDSLLQGNMRGFGNAAGHLILPALTLMTVPLATTARITRSTMLEVLGQDYIRTAHAKGLARRAVIVGHGLRSAMLPIITIVGLQMGGLLSGAVLTETIFAWPGVGKWLFDSIVARDYPIVQSVTLLVAGIYIVVNYLVDILYAFARSPREGFQLMAAVSRRHSPAGTPRHAIAERVAAPLAEPERAPWRFHRHADGRHRHPGAHLRLRLRRLARSQPARPLCRAGLPDRLGPRAR